MSETEKKESKIASLRKKFEPRAAKGRQQLKEKLKLRVAGRRKKR